MDGLPPRASGFAVWDVVRVDFPYANETTLRRRPALVLATPPVHERFAVLWLAMITSARHRSWPGDVTITDLAKAGLAHSCVVRTAKIATLDARLAVRIGVLGLPDRMGVGRCLRETLSAILSL